MSLSASLRLEQCTISSVALFLTRRRHGPLPTVGAKRWLSGLRRCARVHVTEFTGTAAGAQVFKRAREMRAAVPGVRGGTRGRPHPPPWAAPRRGLRGGVWEPRAHRGLLLSGPAKPRRLPLLGFPFTPLPATTLALSRHNCFLGCFQTTRWA